MLLPSNIRLESRANSPAAWYLLFLPLLIHPQRMALAPIAAMVVVLLFAGASFFFALAETALFSLSKCRLVSWPSANPGGRNRAACSPNRRLAGRNGAGQYLRSAAILATALWMALNALASRATILGMLALILIGCEVLRNSCRSQRSLGPSRGPTPPCGGEFHVPLCRVAQRINSAILKTSSPNQFQPHPLDRCRLPGITRNGFSAGHSRPVEKEIILQIITSIGGSRKNS